ncbi:hypothetical protein [Paenibacillus selenitireducens]|uniref:hypothetical protein n=1 Tax=Paenibacillus selenitireducens TaxID=1324314 RepID=UPI001180C610|nr:hypothetical protein [Paenibacillus selenitireducens]
MKNKLQYLSILSDLAIQCLKKGTIRYNGIAHGAMLDKRLIDTCNSIECELGIGIDVDPFDKYVSQPPTIEQRIRAAMIDEYPYQVVYYTRREGATSSIIEIAKENESIVVLTNSVMERQYKEKGIRCMNYRNSHQRWLYGKKPITLIADVVPDEALAPWRRELRGPINRIIAVKSIQVGLDGSASVQGIDLKKANKSFGSEWRC